MDTGDPAAAPTPSGGTLSIDWLPTHKPAGSTDMEQRKEKEKKEEECLKKADAKKADDAETTCQSDQSTEPCKTEDTDQAESDDVKAERLRVKHSGVLAGPKTKPSQKQLSEETEEEPTAD